MDRRTDGRAMLSGVGQSDPRDEAPRTEAAVSGADSVNWLPVQSFRVSRDFERVGDADARTLDRTAERHDEP